MCHVLVFIQGILLLTNISSVDTVSNADVTCELDKTTHKGYETQENKRMKATLCILSVESESVARCLEIEKRRPKLQMCVVIQIILLGSDKKVFC